MKKSTVKLLLKIKALVREEMGGNSVHIVEHITEQELNYLLVELGHDPSKDTRESLEKVLYGT